MTTQKDEGARYMPFVMALAHLRLRVPGASEPGRMARDTTLLQGDREIPAADEGEVDALLGRVTAAFEIEPIKLRMLEQFTPGWPEEMRIAYEGVSNFGAGAEEVAAAAAAAALRRNRDCRLARQLVKLLGAPQDVRKPFGVPPEAAPDVPGILGG